MGKRKTDYNSAAGYYESQRKLSQLFGPKDAALIAYSSKSQDIGESPSFEAIIKRFSSWDKGVTASGFEDNIWTDSGTPTYGKDGHGYRLKAEATFADKYLFGKYEYQIEPLYPNQNSWKYNWYISDLDLYIELNDGLQGDLLDQKIAFNKILGRECLVI